MMRILAALMLVSLSCLAMNEWIWRQRPLNPELAYDALVAKLQKTEAGRHAMDLSGATFMRRDKELIFFGRGQVRLANRSRYSIPLVESYDFQYIAVVGRICDKWESECYEASEFEITGKKRAIPMI
jgi:hypothetical protein